MDQHQTYKHVRAFILEHGVEPWRSELRTMLEVNPNLAHGPNGNGNAQYQELISKADSWLKAGIESGAIHLRAASPRGGPDDIATPDWSDTLTLYGSFAVARYGDGLKHVRISMVSAPSQSSELSGGQPAKRPAGRGKREEWPEAAAYFIWRMEHDGLPLKGDARRAGIIKDLQNMFAQRSVDLPDATADEWYAEAAKIFNHYRQLAK